MFIRDRSSPWFFVLLIFSGLLFMILVNYAISNPILDDLDKKLTVEANKNRIETQQIELHNENLTLDARKQVLEETLDTIAIMATQRAEGKLRQPTRPVEIVATPTFVISEIKLPDGIDDHPSVPFSENVVSVLNSWRKTTTEKYYLIYFGYLTEDPIQGAILVYHPERHDFKPYLTPQRAGGVKIISENGTRITLRSTQGVLFYFDALEEQFVDPEGHPLIIPTITPTVVNNRSSTETPPGPYP